MYNEWLKESELVQPQTQEVQQPTQQPANNMPVDVPPSPAPDMIDTPDTNIDQTIEPSNQEYDTSTETSMSEQEEFEQIDTARKEAIIAFKEKQKEFMEIPQEIRNNPMTDEDKTKVESLKAELQTLNTTMKEAVAKYDEFNDNMLGATSININNEP
ncbi:MAG: hypothetical protein WC123_03650 [Bacilli bacterium]